MLCSHLNGASRGRVHRVKSISKREIDWRTESLANKDVARHGTCENERLRRDGWQNHITDKRTVGMQSSEATCETPASDMPNPSAEDDARFEADGNESEKRHAELSPDDEEGPSVTKRARTEQFRSNNHEQWDAMFERLIQYKHQHGVSIIIRVTSIVTSELAVCLPQHETLTLFLFV